MKPCGGGPRPSYTLPVLYRDDVRCELDDVAGPRRLRAVAPIVTSSFAGMVAGALPLPPNVAAHVRKASECSGDHVYDQRLTRCEIAAKALASTVHGATVESRSAGRRRDRFDSPWSAVPL
jgi:hypothetical protein